MPSHDFILILDFGSQYTQLIARRIREQNVYSEIKPCTLSVAEIRALQPRGIILSGGPNSVYEKGAPSCSPEIFALGIPLLGVCYGQQLLAHHLGGRVQPAQQREYGFATLQRVAENALLQGVPPDSQVWMSHGDSVVELPPGFVTLGRTENSAYAAFGDPARRLYGLQFHPEVAHTAAGVDILRNFVFAVCGCTPDWNPASFVESTVAAIRAQVGREQVLCALSGGVDSAVAAALVHRAIGPQLHCVFVDHGLLRWQEAEEVSAVFARQFGPAFRKVEAAEIFLRCLRGVTDPEQKRKIIGEQFIRVFEAEARQLAGIRFLVQGTLYPDVIESVSPTGAPSATIKSHHNVGGLPGDLQLELVEPLRELFKDEVRRVGALLGLDPALLNRHPFPGPGLAVRILGEVTPERLALLRQADHIFISELKQQGWYDRVWQAFAVLLPVHSVGVMGDNRTYEMTIALRAVTSTDGMTADWARLPHDLLMTVSSRITNAVRGINRVVYDISAKPPSTIEWE
ncbi:MAG: glutamine-hydrolyzing GMP synthase [candidate division KSB1 bacterium]|nr:glutamine-hydrolyzing GMP synthase [candidate division KSB1 bacterium]MDZ7274936.1 glutamine-hydrolyzing GMP synthase [candidate division KSB1 bacterium]MDZ7286612.1 glutamine-hydrolyzing GMP synthase [candidate division KSB1 bacterium]MDZ7299224.1 glutamine-hydrolyzing GMP synthase [candidate division KSB1 bacterium]MDZ7308357.1 glutamine-hydrolyzing GMP synthase [candidate division KSB1 bacterium]